MDKQQELETLLVFLGKAVSMLRQEQGLSQEQVSSTCGIHRTYLSDIENGKRNISIGAFIFLARGLGIAPLELLRRAEELANKQDTSGQE